MLDCILVDFFFDKIEAQDKMGNRVVGSYLEGVLKECEGAKLALRLDNDELRSFVEKQTEALESLNRHDQAMHEQHNAEIRTQVAAVVIFSRNPIYNAIVFSTPMQ